MNTNTDMDMEMYAITIIFNDLCEHMAELLLLTQVRMYQQHYWSEPPHTL